MSLIGLLAIFVAETYENDFRTRNFVRDIENWKCKQNYWDFPNLNEQEIIYSNDVPGLFEEAMLCG